MMVFMHSSAGLLPRARRAWFSFLLLCLMGHASPGPAAETRRLLYVATPGVRDYLEYGGHGILVFEIEKEHRFVKRIASAGRDDQGKPMNVKGICASAKTGRLYVSTLKTLMCFDLISEKLLWEKAYPGGCDRMSITPDGKAIHRGDMLSRQSERVAKKCGRNDRKNICGSPGRQSLPFKLPRLAHRYRVSKI